MRDRTNLDGWITKMKIERTKSEGVTGVDLGGGGWALKPLSGRVTLFAFPPSDSQLNSNYDSK